MDSVWNSASKRSEGQTRCLGWESGAAPGERRVTWKKKESKWRGFPFFLLLFVLGFFAGNQAKREKTAGKKNPQMSGFAFPFNKLFTGLWNRREARESTKVSGGRRKSGNLGRGREPGALAIDLFLLNLEQKNGRWNEKKKREKKKGEVIC